MPKNTRDSQNKRLTTTVYIECSDCIDKVLDRVSASASGEDVLNEYDVFELKILVFHIWDEDRCYIPLTHWKDIVQQIISDAGGFDELLKADAELALGLVRPDREKVRGRALKAVFRRRFRRGRDD